MAIPRVPADGLSLERISNLRSILQGVALPHSSKA
jgi:hypothetical protein